MVELLDFQQQEPVNIVVFSRPDSDFSKVLIATLGPRARLLPIAFVTDQHLTTEFGVRVTPSFVINRPLDNVRIQVQRYTRATLLQGLQPLITVVRSEVLGDCAGVKWTLAALVDRANTSHWHEASGIFRHCAIVFGRKVTYQACDFFDCMRMANLVGVTNVSEPVYIALKKSHDEIIEKIYRGDRSSPSRVRTWLRDQMAVATDEKRRMRELNVPAVPAPVFDAMVANGTTPTLVLFGNPNTEYYKALKCFVAVKKSGIFGNAKFCRFNPETQPTIGLPIRNGKTPRIGVYLAGEELCAVDPERPHTAMIPAIEQCLRHGLLK
jgi:hypothetical protein